MLKKRICTKLSDSKNNGIQKNPFFYPGEDNICIERHVSTVMDLNENLWTVLRYEENNVTHIKVFKNGSEHCCVKDVGEGAIKPVIHAAANESIYIAWSECSDNEWRIMCAVRENNSNDFEKYVVHSSSSLAYEPSICVFKNKLWISWCGHDEQTNNTAIFLTVFDKETCRKPIKAVCGDFDAFRPSIAAGSDIFVACDLYINGTYKIAYLFINDLGKLSELNIIGSEYESWMCPKVLCGKDENYHLVFLTLADVKDEKNGIVDHEVGVIYTFVDKDGFEFLPDKSVGDGVHATKLREGLLGREVYWGYFGLRRNFQPVISKNGCIWLLWEFLFEKDMSQNEDKKAENSYISEYHCGCLAGKRFNGKTWESPVILHEGGTLYCVPSRQSTNCIGISYINQSDILDSPKLCLELIDTNNLKTSLIETDESWARWKPLNEKLPPNERYTTKTDDGLFNLYWADTHTHSKLSPDAEGEPDELIFFARDTAGLDVFAMVDNDYYPHKKYTYGEWRLQQELAEIFTEKDKFIIFPGYEYTYHDEKLQPNFNHRYVLYPRKGGKIFRRVDKGSETIHKLAKKVENSDALMFAHHPSWKLTGCDCDRNVEVCSSWRVCIEEKDFIIKRLKSGERFAFIGSSDTHRAVPGLGGALTGIYAKEHTPESLFEAYRQRRTIATQGLKTVIDFTVGGIFIGGEGIIENIPEIKLYIKCENQIEYAEIIRDGDVIKRIDGFEKGMFCEFYDEFVTPGEHFYFVKVKAVGDESFNEYYGDRDNYSPFVANVGVYRHNFARAKGPFAWSSPIWINCI